MSSTNKTTYYDLSQYIGTDKPTYLGDYNSDMSKIDAGIHSAVEIATTANQTAGSADAKVTQVTENVEALKGRVSVVEGNVSNLQDKDKLQDANINEAKQSSEKANTTANNALSTANNVNIKLNNAKFKEWQTAIQSNSKVTLSVAKIMYNEELKLLACEIDLASSQEVSETETAFKLPNTITPPSKTINLRNCGYNLLNYHAENYFENISARNLTIDTDGYAHVKIINGSRVYISGCFAVPEW